MLPSATVKESLTVQKEGSRTISRIVKHYNLDVIISVGYRVKSNIGTQFRQWALQVIKDHIIRGYSLSKELTDIQKHINNALKEELAGEVVVAKFATPTRHGAIDGKIQIQHPEYYNLEVITSVGYRVKSKNGIKFRR